MKSLSKQTFIAARRKYSVEIICNLKFVYYFEVPNPVKPYLMNTIFKKRTPARILPAFRTIALSALFFAFIILTLYVLINSPA
jgi:hypothetical protein